MDIPKFFRTERLASGLSQRDLAEKMGISHGLVGQWENESKPIPPDRLVQFCIAVGKDASAVFQEGGPLHGRVAETPDEIELLTVFRLVESEHQGQFLRLLKSYQGFPGQPRIDPAQKNREDQNLGGADVPIKASPRRRQRTATTA